MVSVFIVEGWNDDKQLKFTYPDKLETIVTNGTKWHWKIRDKIQAKLDEGKQVYILTDPDAPGQAIADWLKSFFPELVQIDVPKEKACCMTGKRMKYGVEYMSRKDIRDMIGHLID
ncbi:hypothetical protein [Bacillus phage YungSlug]|nr:hypothetical protein [Bacillus phage YungSlug]